MGRSNRELRQRRCSFVLICLWCSRSARWSAVPQSWLIVRDLLRFPWLHPYGAGAAPNQPCHECASRSACFIRARTPLLQSRQNTARASARLPACIVEWLAGVRATDLDHEDRARRSIEHEVLRICVWRRGAHGGEWDLRRTGAKWISRCSSSARRSQSKESESTVAVHFLPECQATPSPDPCPHVAQRAVILTLRSVPRARVRASMTDTQILSTE